MPLLRTLMIVMIATLPTIAPSFAHADAPATQPTDMTPKQALLDWVDHSKTMTVDDILHTMAYTGNDQTAFAQVTAQQVAAQLKLQFAVDAKWGKAAEATVMHAAYADIREDDEQTRETINGDHATLTFQQPNLGPIYLVHINSIWKLDIAAYTAQAADHLADSISLNRQLGAILNDTADNVATGKYADANAAANDLKLRLGKMQ